MTATLWLVATPIGNLGDVTHRAVEVLGTVPVIACEDTRRTGRLLGHLGIERPRLVVVNDHTEAAAVGSLVDRLLAGDDVALVSDAGTPGISDPGHRLVRAAIGAGVAVVAVPGPSAVLAALVVSGLATDRFCFEGFPPRRAGARRARFVELAGEPRTTIWFESPRRVAATVAEMADRWGSDRRVAVARELTKLHEEVWRGDLGQAAAHLAAIEPRGEHVLVVAGAASPEVDDESLLAALKAELAAGVTRREAVDRVARRKGVARNRVYELALALAAGQGSPRHGRTS